MFIGRFFGLDNIGFSDWTGSDVSTKSVLRPGGMKLFT